jgi:hypothetical protein
MGGRILKVSSMDSSWQGWAPFAWILVFLTALSVTGAMWLMLPESIRHTRASDHDNYYRPAAVNLLRGSGLVQLSGKPADNFPPGTSFFLAATFWFAGHVGASPDAALNLVSIVLHALATTLIWQLAALVWGRWKALLSGLLWCFYPPAILAIPLGGSETPFIPVLLLTTLLFWIAVSGARLRPGVLFLVGLGCAGAMLIRPIAIGLPLVIAGFLWLKCKTTPWKGRLAAITFLAFGTACLVLPWEVWVFQRTGRFIVLSSNGFPCVLDGLTYFQESAGRGSLKVPADVSQFTQELVKECDAGRVDSLGSLMSWMVDQLRERPWTVLKLYAIKAFRCWFGTDSHYHETQSMSLAVLFLIGLFLSSYRAISLGGGPRALTFLVLSMAFYNWMMSILVLSILRYMVPVEALLLTLAPALLPWKAKAGT